MTSTEGGTVDWIVCDGNHFPHPAQADCRNPRPPDESIVPQLLRMANDAETRGRHQIEWATTLRGVAERIEHSGREVKP